MRMTRRFCTHALCGARDVLFMRITRTFCTHALSGAQNVLFTRITRTFCTHALFGTRDVLFMRITLTFCTHAHFGLLVLFDDDVTRHWSVFFFSQLRLSCLTLTLSPFLTVFSSLFLLLVLVLSL
jgi:hypothetical protein